VFGARGVLKSLSLQLFDKGGEGFDLLEEDSEGGCPGLFGPARVDGGLSSLDELLTESGFHPPSQLILFIKNLWENNHDSKKA